MGNDATPIARRDFLRMGAAATLMGAMPLRTFATPVRRVMAVPEDKALSPEWIRSLTARGRRTIYRGAELRAIGMPVGGVGAGQVNLGGDGRLWLWDVFNRIKFGVVEKTIQYKGESIHAGGGANYIEPPEQVHPFVQGLTLVVRQGKNSTTKPLDSRGWPDIRFNGEYPVGTVEYRDPDLPVEATLEAFSPFIPLNADDSSLPVTILRVSIRNRGTASVTCDLAGYLQNPVGLHTFEANEAEFVNTPVRDRGASMVLASARAIDSTARIEPDIPFDDFERETWAPWTATGTAFGPGPYERAKMAAYQGDVGGPKGSTRVVNTHNARNGEDVGQADVHKGRLTSPEFTISRRHINFWVGGGNHAGRTCINLLVDGKVVRTATGRADNRMLQTSFEVAEWKGKTAQLEIVDEESGPWGNIGVDEIVFSDAPPPRPPLAERADFGTFAVGILGGGTTWTRSLSSRAAHLLEEAAPETRPVTALGQTFALKPGESRTLTFAMAWRFPNLSLNVLGNVGTFAGVRFKDAGEVIRYLATNADRLVRETMTFRETWYDSTLPFWLLDRTLGNASTLATMTAVRFANGRLYGWEGIGCCDGTCGHVWQYAQSMGRLFPSLERDIRERVDFGVAFRPETGVIEFRGEYGLGAAVDSQAGYVLRTYREHQTSVDDAFLRRVWPKCKKALDYLIFQDLDGDGIIMGRQHNTLDVDLYGPSSWLSSLYQAAVRAGEAMATELGETDYAEHCAAILARSPQRTKELLWNGEYYIHRPDPNRGRETLIYGNGCHVDQVMGQWWCHQVGLPRILDAESTTTALRSLYRYNFLTDVGPYREKHRAGRWYALPGESGLLICTFPQGDREKILGANPVWSSMYFNECMTGFEYEAAGHMVHEGLVTEGLAVTRAVHDRYHAARRNPWNEVECSDHYARCMAVHSVFIALGGYEWHGPKGHIGFAPKVTPENFRTAFTASEGWGTYQQRLRGDRLEASLRARWGQVKVRTFALEVPEGKKVLSATVRLGRQRVAATVAQDGRRVIVSMGEGVVVEGTRTLRVELA